MEAKEGRFAFLTPKEEKKKTHHHKNTPNHTHAVGNSTPISCQFLCCEAIYNPDPNHVVAGQTVSSLYKKNTIRRKKIYSIMSSL